MFTEFIDEHKIFRRKATRHRGPLICLTCFSLIKWDITKITMAYCSNECLEESLHKQRQALCDEGEYPSWAMSKNWSHNYLEFAI